MLLERWCPLICHMPPHFGRAFYVGIRKIKYIPDIGISASKLTILSYIDDVWYK